MKGVSNSLDQISTLLIKFKAIFFKIFENSSSIVRRLYERFRSRSKRFLRVAKISKDFRRSLQNISIVVQHLLARLTFNEGKNGVTNVKCRYLYSSQDMILLNGGN